ncbi:hypothetical protein [Deinococcus multiflagellatus]|uniref:Uncharacterized protein n=1 Tax=Deinococcus multiflagellatus TaxID=1656887 RepID=A0ABW1ZMI3_9DEIO|nr:hypothetical protein [Deinococcus multiflagellatus]MBZ9712278.1 hypothetical protein [Deinococcus multiflagellatus]
MAAQTPFDHWLTQVTAPFPGDTAWRLRAEFSAHHEQAVDALTQLGDPEPAQTALHELGEPATVIAALAHTHFTRADLAWMERDGDLKRLLADPDQLHREPFGRWVAGVALWLGLSVWLLFGLPGLPSSMSAHTAFGLLPGLLLLALVGVQLGERWTVSRRPQRSAAILRRCWRVLWHPLGGLLVAAALLGPHPLLGLVALGLTLHAFLTRPREALSLLDKAWRGAH